MVPDNSTGISPVPAYSGYPPLNIHTIKGLSPSMVGLPMPFIFEMSSIMQVLLPPMCRNTLGLGSSAFARHYLRNHYCFLLLWVLRCFSSPRSPSLRNNHCWLGCPIRTSTDHPDLPVPVAFRSLPRPSSPLRAKASPVRPYLLTLYSIAPFAKQLSAYLTILNINT
jgi:hypothetical protein